MIHGIINVYKEKGFTSHDVVAKLRGIVGQKKIGHTGTLDPDATGVLPVCLGKATKLCDLLTDKNKTYEAVLLLGKTTDTQDITGEVLEEKSTEALTEEKVREAIEGFIGDYEQIPPMYSALKVNGKKLYELAREGKVIERKARPVKILDIQILEIDLPKVRMEVSCSKGTYIRTLCHDIGEKLGCGGCMESLIRTRVSTFRIEDAKTLDEIEALKQEGKLAELLVPMMGQISRGIGHNCPASSIQLAVAKVVDETADMKVYETNMKLLYQELTDLGFSCVRPGGTFYIFPKALEEDAVAFCKKALQYDLILVPSDSFGVKGYFRMAYCIDTEKVERSLEALRRFVKENY